MPVAYLNLKWHGRFMVRCNKVSLNIMGRNIYSRDKA